MTDRDILQLILSKVENLESQVTENTQILKSLEHNAVTQKAELDSLNYKVSELSGNVKTIKSAVVKGEKAYDYLQGFSKLSSTDSK